MGRIAMPEAPRLHPAPEPRGDGMWSVCGYVEYDISEATVVSGPFFGDPDQRSEHAAMVASLIVLQGVVERGDYL